MYSSPRHERVFATIQLIKTRQIYETFYCRTNGTVKHIKDIANGARYVDFFLFYCHTAYNELTIDYCQ